MEQANVHVEVGAMFANKKQLKAACQTFATRANFEYKVLKSDKSRMIIKSIGEGCSWRLHASNVDGRMMATSRSKQSRENIAVSAYNILVIVKRLQSSSPSRSKQSSMINPNIVPKISCMICVATTVSESIIIKQIERKLRALRPSMERMKICTMHCLSTVGILAETTLAARLFSNAPRRKVAAASSSFSAVQLSNMLHNSLSPEHFLLFLIAKKVSLKKLSTYSPIHRMDIVSVISMKICGRISSIRSSRPSSGKRQKPLRR